jgi:hypothetical protein
MGKMYSVGMVSHLIGVAHLERLELNVWAKDTRC